MKTEIYLRRHKVGLAIMLVLMASDLVGIWFSLMYVPTRAWFFLLAFLLKALAAFDILHKIRKAGVPVEDSAKDPVEMIEGLAVRQSVRLLAEQCVQAAQEFVPPKMGCCGSCTVFNVRGQCIDCGWLKPLPGDFVREVPCGPMRVGRLGLTQDENTYVTRLDV